MGWGVVSVSFDGSPSKKARSDARVLDPVPKESITIRVDRDVVDWFRSEGRGYQTRINAVLRAFVDREKQRTG